MAKADEEYPQDQLPSVEDAKINALKNEKKTECPWKTVLSLSFVFVLLLSLGIGLLVSLRRQNVTSPPKKQTLFQLIHSVALNGGDEFASNKNYQSPALSFLTRDPNYGLGAIDDWRKIQRFALACIFFASNQYKSSTVIAVVGVEADDWTDHTNWVEPGVNECTWHGVSCNQNNEVAEIVLPNNNLYGILAPEVLLLKDSLRTLDLSGNPKLSGPIPSQISQLSLLESFSIANCAFTGEFPQELGVLDEIRQFDIQGNSIIGSIPEEFCELSMVSLEADCSDGEVVCNCCTLCF